MRVFRSAVLGAVLVAASVFGAPKPKYPDLYEASIEELQSGLDAGHFTSVDLVKASICSHFISRAPSVNAYSLGVLRTHQ